MLDSRKGMVLVAMAAMLAASMATASCGDDVENEGSSQGGAGGGSPASGSGGCGSECPTGGAGGAGGGDRTCGGVAGLECGPDEFCDFDDDDCGATDRLGTCAPRPMSCDRSSMPTCGCDGAVHDNPCDAHADGTDVSNLGGCRPPTGTFACGSIFCLATQQYCRRVVNDTGGPDSYTCVQLPVDCSGPAQDCACLAGEPCASDSCEEDAAGNITITCPGG